MVMYKIQTSPLWDLFQSLDVDWSARRTSRRRRPL